MNFGELYNLSNIGDHALSNKQEGVPSCDLLFCEVILATIFHSAEDYQIIVERLKDFSLYHQVSNKEQYIWKTKHLTLIFLTSVARGLSYRNMLKNGVQFFNLIIHFF